MAAVYRFLFPVKPNEAATSMFLLALRVLLGTLLLIHGIQKWMSYEQFSTVFPDPLGVGHTVSLWLALFAEVLCSLAFIGGFLYRLVLIPMIFTMGVAFFVIHGGDPFAAKELAFVYLVVFLLMYLIGPGKYSIDKMIADSVLKYNN